MHNGMRICFVFYECFCTVPDGVPRKVVFLARAVPLVSQQFKIFEKYLPNFRVRNHLETVKMLTILRERPFSCFVSVFCYPLQKAELSSLYLTVL